MKRILILILCGLIWSAASLTAEAQTSAEDIRKLSKEEKMKKFVYPLLGVSEGVFGRDRAQ